MIHNNYMIKFLDLKSEIDEIKDEIQERVDEILYTNTNYILGKEVGFFEKHFAEYIGTNHCIGVGNGTDALEIAVQCLHLNTQDEIIAPANTYVSTCLGISNNKLKINLVDIDPNTFQLDLKLLEDSITSETKAVIVVHLTGSCCDMGELMDIVRKHNLILIEDCAQCHGAFFKDKRLGSFGMLSTFSFYPGKNLGALGDGGAICTNNDDLEMRIRKIGNNGCIEKYRHEIIGRNSRLDTFQASVLDIKLRRLDANNEKRRNCANLYYKLLKDVPEVKLPTIVPDCVPVYHLFIVRCKRRDDLKTYLEINNIQTGIHYPISIVELPCYQGVFDHSDFQNAIKTSSEILSLPMYPNLPKQHIETICENIINFYRTHNVSNM